MNWLSYSFNKSCNLLKIFSSSCGVSYDFLGVSYALVFILFLGSSLDYLYVVSNAGCADKDFAHLKAKEEEMRSQKFDVKLERIDDKALVALQGPQMHAILQNGVNFDMKNFPFMVNISKLITFN